MRMNKKQGRCVPISVLMFIRRFFTFSLKAVTSYISPSLVAAFTYLWYQFTKIRKETYEKIHKNPQNQRNKSRYRSASLTVEASLAFPVFFFAVLYLIQLFAVLRAEVVIAEAGISSAREVAAYSYAAERLADGENAAAETLLEVFDQKIVRDAAFTGIFYVRCDAEILEQADVAQGFSGMWVTTGESDEKIQAEVYYRVKPRNVLTEEKGSFHVMRFVYRNWTGEGGSTDKQEEESKDTVYVTEHGKVYHVDKNCSYIKREVSAVASEKIAEERNSSGAGYSSCEYCSPKIQAGGTVYVTKYGTKYHAVSSCSAIKRTVTSCSSELAKENYDACSKCGIKQEGEEE